MYCVNKPQECVCNVILWVVVHISHQQLFEEKNKDFSKCDCEDHNHMLVCCWSVDSI